MEKLQRPVNNGDIIGTALDTFIKDLEEEQHGHIRKEEFQLQLQNRFEVLSNEGENDVEEMVSKITNAIQESALHTAGRHGEQKNEQLKSETKHI